jgi:FAD:protein FMN transferase
MLQTHFRAMGCQMLAMVDADNKPAQDALAQVPAWFEQWEDSLSRFRPESELNRLNRGAGQWFSLSETLWQVLRRAQLAERYTRGLVTPVVLDALEAIGYDRSFELIAGHGAGPANEGSTQPHTALSQHRTLDTGAIFYDPKRRRVRMPAGMRLDFGGIAKGWAADMAARRLSKFGPALVDAGGDVATSQSRSDGNGWPIALENPLEPDPEKQTLIVLGGGAVATSGRDYRRWLQDGRMQHHIIDPRTGRPAETDVLCASVVGPSAAEAEVAAKVALILGSSAGLAWLDAQQEFAGQLVLENGQLLTSQRLDAYLWKPVLDYGHDEPKF